MTHSLRKTAEWLVLWTVGTIILVGFAVEVATRKSG